MSDDAKVAEAREALEQALRRDCDDCQGRCRQCPTGLVAPLIAAVESRTVARARAVVPRDVREMLNYWRDEVAKYRRVTGEAKSTYERWGLSLCDAVEKMADALAALDTLGGGA